MRFKKRNISPSLRKKKNENFLASFPQETKKRFERISEKLKIKTPFSKSSIPATPAVPESKKRIASPILDPKKQHPLLFFTPQRRKIFPFIFTVLVLSGLFSVPFFAKDYLPTQLAKKGLETATELLGAELKKDEYGRINILLLGSGGEGSDGGYLTDSIIVASINTEKNTVSMLSIPRDFYLKKFIVGGNAHYGKINEVFRDGTEYWKYRETEKSEILANSAKTTQEEIEKIIGAKINYTAFIDFEGFESIVDELGGIELDVEKRIYDSSYPAANYQYQTFILEEGLQTLDGETALKYVRSRHGTSGGDFGRSYRQKKALLAVKQKALDAGVLTSPKKIQAIFAIIQKNFWTNLTWDEMLSLITIGKDLSSDQVFSYGLTDDSTQGTGGFLYTPLREKYNNLSVLLPFLEAESAPYSQIKFYFHTISLYPELLKTPGKIEIYNTTKSSGLATKLEQHLLRYGIKSSQVGNSDELYPKTTLEYINTPENIELVSLLQKKLKITPLAIPQTPENKDQNLKIYIGKDFSSNAYTGTMIRKPETEDKKEGVLDIFAQ